MSFRPNYPVSFFASLYTRNPASRATKRALGRMPSSYVHRVTSEVAVSFLPEVVAQI